MTREAFIDRARRGAWPVTLVAAAAVGGAAVQSIMPPFADAQAQAQARAQGFNDALRTQSFADVVEQASPAVVNISVITQIPGGFGGTSGLPALPREFQDFFGRFLEGVPGGGAQPPRQAEGAGSGFIVDPAGYVVTNHHVVNGANRIAVTLQDGRRFEATVVGQDPPTDLALLKIEADGDLPYVAFADSDQARVGEWVLAIGNPFGLGGSATAGIISARGRTMPQGSAYDDYLQIDAPINRGNSGGPVFNDRGEVIGVSTLIFSPNGGNVGIGFAIPSNQASAIVEQLKEGGTVTRGFLGVTIQNLDDALADSLGLDSTSGALIVNVDEGTPAAAAGLEPGDVVTRLDGRVIDDTRELTREVGLKRPGTRTEIEYVREGETRRATVELAENTAVASAGRFGAPSGEVPGAGLSLAPLTDRDRTNLGIDPKVNGVLVSAVRPDSKAAEKALQPGDVIVQVNRRPATSVAEVQGALDRAAREGGNALLLVQRGNQRQFVALDFSAG